MITLHDPFPKPKMEIFLRKLSDFGPGQKRVKTVQFWRRDAVFGFSKHCWSYVIWESQLLTKHSTCKFFVLNFFPSFFSIVNND